MSPRSRSTSGSSSPPGQGSPRRSLTSKASSTETPASANGAPAKPTRRKPRALTQAQLIAKLLKIVGPSRPARSSVRLARGPRGQVMPEVLIHAGDEPGLATVEAVEAKAREVFDRLCAAYPLDHAAGNGAPDS